MAQDKAADDERGPDSLFVKGGPMDGRFLRDESELLHGSPRFLSRNDDGLQLSIHRNDEGYWVFALHAEEGELLDRSPPQSRVESPSDIPINSDPTALGFRTNDVVIWPHYADSWEEWFETEGGGSWYTAKGLVVRDGVDVSAQQEEALDAAYLQAAVGQTLLVQNNEEVPASSVPNSPVKIARRRGRRPRQQPVIPGEAALAEAKDNGVGEGGSGGGGAASDDKAEIERLRKELAEAKQEVGRLRAASSSLQVVHSDEISWDQPRVRLGSGGFGVVFRSKRGGWQGVTVAVKELRLDTEALEDDAIADLRREGEVLAMVRHPNVVGFLGLCPDPVSPFIVTEFVDGGSLHEILYKSGRKSGRGASAGPALTLREKLRVAAEVTAGLEHLHSKPMVHRDLKPSNVLLTSSGQAKVCDFGLSRALTCTRAYIRTNVRGTPLYMSPEQWESSELTVKVDVYAFGVLLNELLVGVAPWRGLASPMAIGFRVCKGERPVTAQMPTIAGDGGASGGATGAAESHGSGVVDRVEFEPATPPELIGLVEQCWAPDAKGRPAMFEVRRVIESWLESSWGEARGAEQKRWY